MLKPRWLLLAFIGLINSQPAAAQVVFEWHQIAAIGAPPATNAPLDPFASFNSNPNAGGGLLNLAPGQVVFLQLMLRDLSPNSYPWAYGDGLVPPTDPINGVGLTNIGCGVRGIPSVFSVGGNAGLDRRLVIIPDSESPVFSLPWHQPYSGPSWTSQPILAGMDFQVNSYLLEDNLFENGDFPHGRAGTVASLMPFFNMRFVAGPNGSGTLTIVDARPGIDDNRVGGDNGATLAFLDAQLFSTAPVINVSIVPEPSSVVLMVIPAVIGWRRLPFRKNVTQ